MFYYYHVCMFSILLSRSQPPLLFRYIPHLNQSPKPVHSPLLFILGTIPDSLGQLFLLTSLRLYNNQLSGEPLYEGVSWYFYIMASIYLIHTMAIIHVASSLASLFQHGTFCTSLMRKYFELYFYLVVIAKEALRQNGESYKTPQSTWVILVLEACGTVDGMMLQSAKIMIAWITANYTMEAGYACLSKRGRRSRNNLFF